MKAIETMYAGTLFRSRLEARWAVFFDEMEIPWEYEPEGFELSTRQRWLPDFLLSECGTWVEVKGHESGLNKDLLIRAASEVPKPPHRVEAGPKLMVLGPIPRPLHQGDWTWISISDPNRSFEGEDESWGRYGFGTYHKNKRPWWSPSTENDWLIPAYDEWERDDAMPAYSAARSARFEHSHREVWNKTSH